LGCDKLKFVGQNMLFPLSIIYGAVTRARLRAYKLGLLSTAKLPAPVISVGNLTTGGTGKTPLVEWICRQIAADGRRVCILTRGYGRVNPKMQVVVSNGTEILAGASEAGDEPLLLAENLLGRAAVVCNANRIAAGRWAIENLGTEVFVLDDGFQHLGIARDLDIVAIDATEPWGYGGGKLLPRGRLREPKPSLSRADCVVITRADQARDLDVLRTEVRQLNGDIPIFTSHMATSQLSMLDGKPAPSPPQSAGAFCGVGNSDSFFDHLRRAGHELVFTRAFPDHHRYKQSDVDALVQEAKAKGVASLLTTAKDAIKVRSLDLPIPCYVLEIRIVIEDEDRFIKLIRDSISRADATGQKPNR
jgi:tetraacyldisaccharide 4'-kinase